MTDMQTSHTVLLYQQFTDDFKEVDWTIIMSGPFELNNPIQALLMEAGQKGMCVIVQASLVPSDVLFPPDEELEDLAKELKDSKAKSKGKE